MAHGTVQRDDVIDRRSRCYGIMIEADGNTGNGTSFHNDISAVIAAFMAIAGHYSKPVHAVRWRFQAERAEGDCIRDDMRCGDDDEGLDMRPGPFIRFRSARRDGDAG